MEIKQKLIDLLNQYIEENKKLKEEYNQKRTNQTLYEELITTLKEQSLEEMKLYVPILLNTIYGNNIYLDEFYSILYKPDNQEELRQFIIKIENEYNELKFQNHKLKWRITRNQEMVSSAHRARKSITLETEILDTKNDIFNVKRIINYFEISGVISKKEEILLINEIEAHNRKVGTKYGTKEEQDYAESLYNEIPNILTIGLQEHDVIEVSNERKPTLDKFAKEIINLVNNIEIDQINELLENYQKYNLDNNEYNYIIVEVLNSYLDDLITLYTLLLEKEIYIKRKQRIDVVRDYYNTLERYITILNYYNKINEFNQEENPEETPKEQTEEYSEEKRLIYSHSDMNITKSKLISDMSDIPYEYYDTVYDLLTRFKNGTIGSKEVKILPNKQRLRGHLELKYDQVRIVLKHIKDDIYNVLGVFTKKANNDMTMYGRIFNRMTPDVDTDSKLMVQLELAKQTEEELEKLVKEKGRKGTR